MNWGMFRGKESYVWKTPKARPLTRTLHLQASYASVGPEHAWLKDIGRVNYSWATDQEAMSAFKDLCETEGIIPAMKTSTQWPASTRQLQTSRPKGMSIRS